MSTGADSPRHDERVLILMRHAKAGAGWGVDDHERSLSPDGEADAPVAGQWLLDNHLVPEMILCSSALRTRQTCTWVSSELGELAPTANLSDRLYEASDAQVLAEINAVPDSVRTLMVICHQPAVQDAAIRLASADSDMDAVMDLSGGYPTSGLAVLRTQCSWSELDGADARLTDFEVPRGEGSW
ncbi:SixA phosphatase family protein [Kocuria sp.]|uniref:SixA phosphatase family protein n=1 Tax=Kocuria sp. TaxID=1871328 RepID=UPI0026DFE67F|nr:histidine phosphatase family protein [Kocuria sp.]MDO5618688.1 histidine phosphatase family protein [Kocuria sp.]